MKKSAIIFLSITGIYILGFFAVAPLSMLSTSTQVVPIMQAAHGIHDKLYWSWVQRINESNLIRRVWNENGVFWCSQFETCTVGVAPSNT